MELVFENSYGEESYGLVYKNGDVYEVYEVPQYGGVERFYKTCSDLDEAIKYAKESFT